MNQTALRVQYITAVLIYEGAMRKRIYKQESSLNLRAAYSMYEDMQIPGRAVAFKS